eukprot:UN25765
MLRRDNEEVFLGYFCVAPEKVNIGDHGERDWNPPDFPRSKRWVKEITELFCIAIHPAYNRQGLGGHLLKLITNKYSIVGLHVSTVNKGAMRLYEKFNFRKVRTIKNYYGSLKQDAEKMLYIKEESKIDYIEEITTSKLNNSKQINDISTLDRCRVVDVNAKAWFHDSCRKVLMACGRDQEAFFKMLRTTFQDVNEEFHYISKKKKGRITVKDIKKILTKHDGHKDSATLLKILREIKK